MRIHLRSGKKLYHALYSDVFSVDGRVFKLFKRFGQSSFDERAATIFEAQCDAYERVTQNSVLKSHVPDFFGACLIEAVEDEDGEDVSSRYRLDACYVISEITGPEKKVNDEYVRLHRPHVSDIRRTFNAISIDTGDASVFCYDDAVGFKLIDFISINF